MNHTFLHSLQTNVTTNIFFNLLLFSTVNLSASIMAAHPNICFFACVEPPSKCSISPSFFFLGKSEYHCCLLYFPPLQDFPFRSPPSASYPVCDVGDNVSRFLASPLRILGGRTRANTNTNRLLSCRQWGKCRQMSGSCWKLLSGRSFCIYFRGEIIDDWRPVHNAF